MVERREVVRPVSMLTPASWAFSEMEYCGVSCSSRPHKSLATRALKSSLRARKIRPQRTQALGRDNRDAPRLAGEGEELLVPGRVVLPHGREGVVLVAQEQ